MENRKSILEAIHKSVTESGLFSSQGIKQFMTMLSQSDSLLDVELITAFLYRDGMKNHSFVVVKSFIKRLPLNQLT